MIHLDALSSVQTRPVRRVLILADDSADWKVAGLRQLDRLALSLDEFIKGAQAREPISVCIWWRETIAEDRRWLPYEMRLQNLRLTDQPEEFLREEGPIDLVLSTKLFLHRASVPQLVASLPVLPGVKGVRADSWETHASQFDSVMADPQPSERPWQYLSGPRDIPACERTFLRTNGKSQDGLVSRYLNRGVSRWVTRWLLKLPLVPSVWSVLIFALPLAASYAFVQGDYAGFVIGCAIFQLYSILDGCDGEIARARFLHTEFGRRLDSLLDLMGNILLALSVGIGLAHQAEISGGAWFYLAEGIAAALLIGASEGLVFARRSRSIGSAVLSARWNAALYQRHHEFLERSGLLFLGEKVAWWLVQLTKRDMGMLAFFVLAILGWPEGILHLLFTVSGITLAFASNAFLRQPAPAAAPQTS